MARLIDPFDQYFDGAGAPLAQGKLWFYASGSSTTAKNTYADAAENITNTNPVILTGDGRAPNIFGPGQYRVILTDKDDVQILQRDPVGGIDSLPFGADWVSYQRYSVSDVVRDDGKYWKSLIGNNQNNRPSTDGGARWERVVYNALEINGISGTTVANKAGALLLNPAEHPALFISGTDGGTFYADTGKSPGAYTDNGGAYCGTVIVPTGGDGSSAFLKEYNGLIPAVSFGVTADGTTVDATALQSAIDYAAILGGEIELPAGTINLGTIGITLPEGVSLTGKGQSVNSAIGTAFIYSGAGNAITINGEWTGFDARRYIKLSNFYLYAGAGSSAGIYGDFLTQFEFDNVYIYGLSTHGIDLINSYDGYMRKVRTSGQTDGLRMDVKATPNDVYSGQTIFENCDFWNHSGIGADIKSNYNVFALLIFTRCLVQSCGTGFKQDGTNTQSIVWLNSQFENNTTHDVHVTTSVLHGPKIDACYSNSSSPTNNFLIEGKYTEIIDTKFIDNKTGANCINITGDYNIVERTHIRQKSGNTLTSGVTISGDNNRVRDGRFINAVSGAMACIVNSGANNIIGKQHTENVTSGIISDSGTSTTYEESVNIVTNDFDLSGAAVRQILGSFNRAMYVRKVRIIYTEASSADAGVQVALGRKVSGGAEALTQYVNFTSEVSKAQYDETIPTISATYIAPTDSLVAYCAGGKTGTGEARLHIELVPYPYL